MLAPAPPGPDPLLLRVGDPPFPGVQGCRDRQFPGSCLQVHPKQPNEARPLEHGYDSVHVLCTLLLVLQLSLRSSQERRQCVSFARVKTLSGGVVPGKISD